MRLPSYFKVHNVRVEPDGSLVCDFTFRRWHPGWWLLYAKVFLSALQRCKLIITIRGKEFVIGAKG